MKLYSQILVGVMFKQNCEGKEEMSLGDTGGGVFQAKGTASSKAQKIEQL